MVLFLTPGLHIHGDEVLSLSWLWVAWVVCRQGPGVVEAGDTEKKSSLKHTPHKTHVGGTTVAAAPPHLSLWVQEELSTMLAFCALSPQCPRTSSRTRMQNTQESRSLLLSNM